MNELQFGFVFHKENCIQCYGCEGACKAWRAVAPGVKWRRVDNIWQGNYPDVTCSSVSVSCQHCAEPACVSVCPTNAVSKRSADGLVLIDRDKCTGCQACLAACPYNVPQFGADGIMQKCDMCQVGHSVSGDTSLNPPPCVRTCSTHALEFIKMTASSKIDSEQNILNCRNP